MHKKTQLTPRSTIILAASAVNNELIGRTLVQSKGRAPFKRVRGRDPVNRQAFTRLVSVVLLFGVTAENWLVELDFNSLLAGPNGATAVYWLMPPQG